MGGREELELLSMAFILSIMLVEILCSSWTRRRKSHPSGGVDLLVGVLVCFVLLTVIPVFTDLKICSEIFVQLHKQSRIFKGTLRLRKLGFGDC